jgi:hypothetical protein
MTDTIESLRAQLAAEKARADDLSRMVAAMGEGLELALSVANDCHQRWSRGHPARVEKATAILSRPDVAAERGRWRKVEEYDAAIARAEKAEAEARTLKAKNIDAERHRDEWKERFSTTEDDADEWHRRAEAAERSRDELGIQLAAQSERLRLAMACVKAADFVINDSRLRGRQGVATYFEARAALDAVPGDALASAPGLPPPPVRVPTPALGVAIRTYEAEHDIGPALDRAHEASGVVTGGVKGVE